MKTRALLCLDFLAIAMALTSSPAAAQVDWRDLSTYDTGQQPSLAMHFSGLILEFHRTDNNNQNTLWYHVGRVNGTNVSWGESHQAPTHGTWPNVVITNDGHVLFIWSTGYNKSESTLQYMVGQIDLNGDINQTIHWLSSLQSFDAGFHSTTAITRNGVIVEVHESGTGGSGMYYRVGHFPNLSGGNYNIIWDSGNNGRYYDDGIDPHIAVNNLNQVVETHQAGSSNHYLHYHRGTVLSNGTIDFRPSQRYNHDGVATAVALLDSGQVLEVHSQDGELSGGAYSIYGTLNPFNNDLITWSTAQRFSDLEPRASGALTTDGIMPGPRIAVGVWSFADPWGVRFDLYSAIATIQYPPPSQ